MAKMTVNFSTHPPLNPFKSRSQHQTLFMRWALPDIWSIDVLWPTRFDLIFKVKVMVKVTILAFCTAHVEGYNRTKNQLRSTSSSCCYPRTQWHTCTHYPVTSRAMNNSSCKSYQLLPLDEAIASRAVYVIVSGSDGRTDGRAGGRKRFAFGAS